MVEEKQLGMATAESKQLRWDKWFVLPYKCLWWLPSDKWSVGIIKHPRLLVLQEHILYRKNRFLSQGNHYQTIVKVSFLGLPFLQAVQQFGVSYRKGRTAAKMCWAGASPQHTMCNSSLNAFHQAVKTNGKHSGIGNIFSNLLHSTSPAFPLHTKIIIAGNHY